MAANARIKNWARLSTLRAIPRRTWSRNFAKPQISQIAGRLKVSRANNSQNFQLFCGSSMGLCFQMSPYIESTYRASSMYCRFRSAYLKNCQFFMFFANNSVKNCSTLRFNSSKEREEKTTSNERIISRASRDMRLYNPVVNKKMTLGQVVTNFMGQVVTSCVCVYVCVCVTTP